MLLAGGSPVAPSSSSSASASASASCCGPYPRRVDMPCLCRSEVDETSGRADYYLGGDGTSSSESAAAAGDFDDADDFDDDDDDDDDELETVTTSHLELMPAEILRIVARFVIAPPPPPGEEDDHRAPLRSFLALARTSSHLRSVLYDDAPTWHAVAATQFDAAATLRRSGPHDLRGKLDAGAVRSSLAHRAGLVAKVSETVPRCLHGTRDEIEDFEGFVNNVMWNLVTQNDGINGKRLLDAGFIDALVKMLPAGERGAVNMAPRSLLFALSCMISWFPEQCAVVLSRHFWIVRNYIWMGNQGYVWASPDNGEGVTGRKELRSSAEQAARHCHLIVAMALARIRDVALSALTGDSVADAALPSLPFAMPALRQSSKFFEKFVHMYSVYAIMGTPLDGIFMDCYFSDKAYWPAPVPWMKTKPHAPGTEWQGYQLHNCTPWVQPAPDSFWGARLVMEWRFLGPVADCAGHVSREGCLVGGERDAVSGIGKDPHRFHGLGEDAIGKFAIKDGRWWSGIGHVSFVKTYVDADARLRPPPTAFVGVAMCSLGIAGNWRIHDDIELDDLNMPFYEGVFWIWPTALVEGARAPWMFLQPSRTGEKQPF